jgi:hypothetical protein
MDFFLNISGQEYTLKKLRLKTNPIKICKANEIVSVHKSYCIFSEAFGV